MNVRRVYTYDSYRRCTSYTEPLNSPGPDCSNVASRRWDWIYDRIIEGGGGYPPSSHTSREWRIQVEPVFNSNGDRRATDRKFDVNNRITSEQTGLIQLNGSTLGTLTAVDGQTETHRFSYDENGQKSTYTDPLGRETDYTYDNRNRLWKTIEYPMPTASPHITETLYNAVGDKTKVIFPDGKTQEWPDENYDAFGQPHLFKDELHNPTDMEYWLWGPMKKLFKVTTHRDGDSQPTTFSYDPMGRPQQTLFPDGSSEFNGRRDG